MVGLFIFIDWETFSSNCKKDNLFTLLDSWIEKDIPSAIMGDMNVTFFTGEKLKKANTRFVSMMTMRGFHQLIKEPTHHDGNIIDHIYVNDAMLAQTFTTNIDAAYYSDHDIISLYIKKQ